MVIGNNISEILDAVISRMISCVTLFRTVWVTVMDYILSSMGYHHASMVPIPVYINSHNIKNLDFKLYCIDNNF